MPLLLCVVGGRWFVRIISEDSQSRDGCIEGQALGDSDSIYSFYHLLQRTSIPDAFLCSAISFL